MHRDRVLHCALLFLLLPVALAAQNVITTIAGIDLVFNGDGKPAVNVGIGYINGVATDGSGNVYFTDPLEHLVLRVAADGTLSVIAGNGIAAYSGDGGPATAAAIAAFDDPHQYIGPPVVPPPLSSSGRPRSGRVREASGHPYCEDGRTIGADGEAGRPKPPL